ncbi:MAG: hypothetical protein BWY74_02968 [Firmicutes bacterium ADurb.Bin419]|nr:MAG: hypothetical protein BWY74_02968 [Firmicutes bacterium ADurb.Bin419]
MNNLKEISPKNGSIMLKLVFFLIFIYAIQDFLSSANTGLRNANRISVHISLFIILFVLCTHCIFMVIKRGIRISYFEATLWGITLWTIVVNMFNGSDIWSSLVHVGISLLWVVIYSFFHNYVQEYPNSLDSILKYIFVLFLFYIGATIYAKINIQGIYERTAVVNYVYYNIVLLPWIMLISSKAIRNVGFIVIIIMVQISMKRGAIIVLPVMLIVHYLVDGKVNHRKIKNIFKLLVVISIVFIGLIYVNNLYSNFLGNRFTAEALESGSGRNEIYKLALDNIINRNAVDFLIGLGSGSTLQYIGAAAHNDWLEFIFSFGFIGILLYLLFFVALVSKTFKLIKNNCSFSSTYTVSIVYILAIGMVGMVFFAHSTLYLMALFGTVDALESNTRLKCTHLNHDGRDNIEI